MNNILEWYNNYQKLTDEERICLNKTCPEIKLYDNFKDIENRLFNYMLYSNISSENRKISFSACATDFINLLFNKYVDDETLVISTNCEHDNVKKNLIKCKNLLVLDFYNDVRKLNTSKITNIISNYKKVFVYIIGTQISTGEITPQQFYNNIKNIFISHNIDHKIVIDDVHGMFIVPRDYTVFDYIISTAHALVRDFDMGILISKNLEFGEQISNWGAEYLKCLEVILNRKDKLNIFRFVMTEYFSKYLATGYFELLDRTTNNIFSMKIHKLKFTKSMSEKLKEYEIRVESDENSNSQVYLRFRAQQFIKRPDFLIDGIKYLESILGYLIEEATNAQ